MPGPTSRTLIVLRHAKSDWPAGVPDHQRPLSDRGRRDAPVAGRWLADHDLVPDIAYVSPAKRTRSTWELAAAQLPAPVPVQVVENMYAADWTDLLAVVRAADEAATTIVVVGHNPGCEELAESLSGPGSDRQALAAMAIKYPTAGIAVLEIPTAWAGAAEGSGVLRAFEVPRG